DLPVAGRPGRRRGLASADPAPIRKRAVVRPRVRDLDVPLAGADLVAAPGRGRQGRGHSARAVDSVDPAPALSRPRHLHPGPLPASARAEKALVVDEGGRVLHHLDSRRSAEPAGSDRALPRRTAEEPGVHRPAAGSRQPMTMTRLMSCRACGSERLQPVLDLGQQALSGMFPRPGRSVPTGPVQLVRCLGCSLLQLAHTADLTVLYGMEYGYRSGLNSNMAAHLQERVARVREIARPVDGDLIVDIGSNDGTALRAWGDRYDLVGIDPTGTKFREFYPPNVRLIPEFFPSARLEGRKAKVVTSFAMFYDVPDPA